MTLIRDKLHSWLLIEVCIRLHVARAGVMWLLNRVQGGVLLPSVGPGGMKRHLQVNQHQDTCTLFKLRLLYVRGGH